MRTSFTLLGSVPAAAPRLARGLVYRYDLAHLGALLVNRTGKLRGHQDADLNADRLQPRINLRILADGSDVISDPVATGGWQVASAEEAHDAVESKFGESGFYRGRHIRRDRRALPVGD